MSPEERLDLLLEESRSPFSCILAARTRGTPASQAIAMARAGAVGPAPEEGM
jgi:hypothetical protein